MSIGFAYVWFYKGQKDFGIPQKQVHCIYVELVNGIPHEEFGI